MYLRLLVCALFLLTSLCAWAQEKDPLTGGYEPLVVYPGTVRNTGRGWVDLPYEADLGPLPGTKQPSKFRARGIWGSGTYGPWSVERPVSGPKISGIVRVRSGSRGVIKLQVHNAHPGKWISILTPYDLSRSENPRLTYGFAPEIVEVGAPGDGRLPVNVRITKFGKVPEGYSATLRVYCVYVRSGKNGKPIYQPGPKVVRTISGAQTMSLDLRLESGKQGYVKATVTSDEQPEMVDTAPLPMTGGYEPLIITPPASPIPVGGSTTWILGNGPESLLAQGYAKSQTETYCTIAVRAVGKPPKAVTVTRTLSYWNGTAWQVGLPPGMRPPASKTIAITQAEVQNKDPKIDEFGLKPIVMAKVRVKAIYHVTSGSGIGPKTIFFDLVP